MKRSLVALLVVAAAALAVPALAQNVVDADARESIRGVPDRWGLNVASFWQAFDTRLKLTGTETKTGTDIDIETDLHMPTDATNLMFNGYYRFSDHSRLDVSYLGWNRKNSATIDKEIEWGDVTYEAGATLSSKLSGRMLNLIYKYSFFNNGKVTFGVNGGLSSLWTQASLEGEGTISGGGSASGTLAEKKDVIVPVPVVGVHFEMTLTKGLFWRADGNFFKANIAGYDGSVNELSTSLAYYFTRNVGIGAGFDTYYIRVNHTGDNGGELNARVGFDGVRAFLTANF